MDTFLATASRREVRRYDARPLPGEVVRRILDAGRLAGSARNRQPWRFVVVESAERRERLAQAVYVPDNVHGAALVVAIVGSAPLDAGRAMQNMLLAAWNDGVGSCPNGAANPDEAAAAVGTGEGEQVAIVLTFGYPAKSVDPQRRSADVWSARADRKPLEELVTRV